MKHLSNRLSALAIAGATIAIGAQASAADPMSREICKQVVPSVGKQYAGILQPIAREGHCLAGDFNGDGKPDAIMVVKVLVGKVAPTTGIKTLPTFWEQTHEKGRLQFLALHSTASAAASAWDKYDRLLLDGNSPILVLRREEMVSDMLRVTPRSREVKELQVPRKDMRGDGMHLDTEAVSAILYWNGKKYVFHEDPAGP
jgi:hypothetical protein